MRLFLENVVTFEIAFVLPVIMVWGIPWPKRWWWRALIAVVTSWIALVSVVTLVFCPMDIEERTKRGEENPYLDCDNNNTAPLLLIGWVFPAIPLGIIGTGRWFLRKFGTGKRSGEPG